MNIQFRKFKDFKRGIIYDILKDAYSFDSRCFECWGKDWREFAGKLEVGGEKFLESCSF